MKFLKDKVVQSLLVLTAGLSLLAGGSEISQKKQHQENQAVQEEADYTSDSNYVDIVNYYRVQWANDIQDKCGIKTSQSYLATTYPGIDYRKAIDEHTTNVDYNRSNLYLVGNTTDANRALVDDYMEEVVTRSHIDFIKDCHKDWDVQ